MTRFVMDAGGFGSESQRNPWSELVAVGIRTSADGPLGEDLFWQFLLRDGFFEVPSSQMPGAHVDVLREHLPGFDWSKVISAMGSTAERIFHLWDADHPRGIWAEEKFRVRFVALVAKLGGNATAAPDVFAKLSAAWGGATRRYHDHQHLAECLRELDRARPESPITERVELALWYHDAVYVPGARGNEQRSAELLKSDAEALRISPATIRAAMELVMATVHEGSAPVDGFPAQLIHDIDLSIFGRDMLRVMDFEYGIEEEFASIPKVVFRLGRGRFLAALLNQPSIYRTKFFRDLYEAPARAHIRALLESRRYRAHRWFRRLAHRPA